MRHIKYIANGLGIWFCVYGIDWLTSKLLRNQLAKIDNDFYFYGSCLLIAIISCYIVGWIFTKE